MGQAPSSPGRSLPGEYRDDEYETPGWKQALQKLIPPVPNLGKLFRLGRKDNYLYASLDAWETDEEEEQGRGGIGLFGLFRKRPNPSPLSQGIYSSRRDKAPEELMPPLVSSMLSRCNDGKTTSLLQEADKRKIRFIGRYQAVLDVAFLLLIMLGLQQTAGLDQLMLPLPKTFDDVVSIMLPKLGSILNDALGTWAIFAFLYAYLSSYARKNVLNQRVARVSSQVSASVQEEVEYAQLYLQLVAAVPMDPNLPGRLAATAERQVATLASKARLNSYVLLVLGAMTIMTVSVLGPILVALSSTFSQIGLLQEWRTWPIHWDALFEKVGSLLQTLFLTLEGYTAQTMTHFMDRPLQFAFHLSMFGSLVVCALLPRFEERRAIAAAIVREDDENEDLLASNMETVEEWSRLGTSSASRLSMLSENGSVENALERWRASHLTLLEDPFFGSPALSSLLRLGAYTVIAALLAIAPVAVSYMVGKTTSLSSPLFRVPRWDSFVDLSLLQITLFALVYQALYNVMQSIKYTGQIKNFSSELGKTKNDLQESSKSNIDLQVMASVSSSAGLTIRDLWAAHTSKRAWAVRGATLQCKNGEILAIIGDDGEGKTRLLTTLAESLVFPPKRSLTTNKVRGYIGIGGLEASKWDRKMLKRRIGILLSDIRMTADSASLFSGWNLEEILEPVDGHRNSQNDRLQRKLTSNEKSSILLALKVCSVWCISQQCPIVAAKVAAILIDRATATLNSDVFYPATFLPRRSLDWMLLYFPSSHPNSQQLSLPTRKICAHRP